MPASTLIDERPVAPERTELPVQRADVTGPTSQWRRAMPLVAMAGGLAALLVAALLFVGPGQGHRRTVATATAADPSAITVSARDVSVVTQVYDAGQDSGWHSHPGIHAVAVLSGTLTVYDSQCQRHTYEPGRPYVGGQEPHLVRNETGEPVTMSVTYLSPSVPAGSTEHMVAPVGCVLG